MWIALVSAFWGIMQRTHKKRPQLRARRGVEGDGGNEATLKVVGGGFSQSKTYSTAISGRNPGKAAEKNLLE